MSSSVCLSVYLALRNTNSLVDNSNWDPSTFNIADAQEAIDQNPFDIATWNADISDFKNAGGKLRKLDSIFIGQGN